MKVLDESSEVLICELVDFLLELNDVGLVSLDELLVSALLRHHLSSAFASEFCRSGPGLRISLFGFSHFPDVVEPRMLQGFTGSHSGLWTHL